MARINVIDKLGRAGTIDESELTAALQSGDYRLETQNEADTRKYLEENKGLVGAAKVFGAQAANQALFGVPEIAYNNLSDEDKVQKLEALKEAHPAANIAGGITGFIGSLAYGGPLFKGATKVGEAVATGVSRVGQLESKNIASKVITGLAKTEVAQQAAKIAAEGAALSLPMATTELITGNPDKAAEDIAISSIAGGALGTLGYAGKKIITALDGKLNLSGALKKTAKGIFKIPEEDIDYYLKNRDRVETAPSIEDIKDQIDADVLKYKFNADKAKEKVLIAEGEQKEAYKRAIQDLKEEKVPVDIAQGLGQELEQNKLRLHEMKIEALDELEKANGIVQTKQVKGLMTGIINELKFEGTDQIIGRETEKAYNILLKEREYLEKLPSEITFKQLRRLIDTFDGDVVWEKMAGEFNKVADRKLIDFLHRIRTDLKEQVPMYDQKMQKLYEATKIHEKMTKEFGDITKSTYKLGKTLEDERTRNLLQDWSNDTGSTIFDKLSEFQSKKSQLKESLFKDMGEVLTPVQYRTLQDVKAEYNQALAEYDPISRLSEGRTQSIIRNQGWKNASIEDRRAIEELNKKTGKDYLTLIKDRNVLDAFGKDSTNGSRKTLLGGIIGAALGGPLGATIGGVAGAEADAYGGIVLKKALNKVKDLNVNISEVFTKTRLPENSSEIALTALTRFLGNDEKKNKKELINDIADKINTIKADPNKMTEWLTVHAAPLQGLTPKIHEQYITKMNNIINYISGQLPHKGSVSPIDANGEKDLTDKEIYSFQRKMASLIDPNNVLKNAANGTLTTSEVNVVRALYPERYKEMQNQLMDYLVTKPQLKNTQRQKIKMILDVQPDLTRYNSIQNIYKQMNQRQEQKPLTSSKIKLSNNMSTEVDRIMYR